jgi:limonene-1,2-epoxide hydrolase
MTDAESANLTLIREYLSALEICESAQALTRFFTPDVRQIELPNMLNPGESDLLTLLQRFEQGRRVVGRQKYIIQNALAQGNQVAVEAHWTGVLSTPLGSFAAGATMTAYFAMFFEFENGRIRLQRNYDCFLPW